MPLIIIVLLLFAAAIYGPQWWAQRILKRYSHERDDFPGNGGEFAQHLVKQLGLAIKVETTEKHGDHYDPVSKTVRLSPANYHGKSLTAVVVAAHEIGHALQDKRGYQPLHARTRLVGIAQQIERTGAVLMLALPVVLGIFRVPAAGLLTALAGLISLSAPAIVHLITLPVEWDASFRRALPLLQEGKYLNPNDQRIARRILTACALTYVAASLASLLNLARWIALLRR